MRSADAMPEQGSHSSTNGLRTNEGWPFKTLKTRLAKLSSEAHTNRITGQRLCPQASVAESSVVLPACTGSTAMAKPSKHHPCTLCLDLRSERDAIEVAKRIAHRLAEGSQGRGCVITVSDEYGNVVGKISVPRKN
jgi:hypothetical protein